MRVETIIMFGTCGVLDKSIEECSIIIPNAAIRDEGTSYHYIPASDEIEETPKYIPEFVSILKEFNTHYTIGKTWTTDAFYRETPKKMAKRIESGCISVEMECAAATAVAKFREKEFFEFFYKVTHFSRCTERNTAPLNSRREGTADENVFGFHTVSKGFQRSFQINENEIGLARQIRNVEFL